MQISHLQRDPFHLTPYLNATRQHAAQRELLPWMRGTVEGLPEPLEGLLVTGDLQGRGRGQPPLPLLGEVVAAEYAQHAAQWGVPDPGGVGVLLAGDYYAAPEANKRGATGDVSAVWQAFASVFGWVAGVLGNHDEVPTLPANAALLDGGAANLGGLSVAGVSGIVGNPKRHARRELGDYLARVEGALHGKPDALLLHQPPQLGPQQRGETELTPLLADHNPLTVCGHVHWEEPLAELGGGQVLNVDSRVVVLTCA